MSQNLDIRFPDLAERDKSARNQLNAEHARLKARKRLTLDEQNELARIEALLARLSKAPLLEVADPLWVALRDSFNNADGLFRKKLANHKDGVIKITRRSGKDIVATNALVPGGGTGNFGDLTKVSLVYGLLAADEVTAPKLVHVPTSRSNDPEIVADTNDPQYEEFSRKLYAAVGEANSTHELAVIVLSRLEEEGDPDGEDNDSGQVRSIEFARVVRCLRKKGVRPNQPSQLRRAINECLDQIQQVGIPRPMSQQGIALPLFNSDELTAFEIQADHVRLCAVPICVTMFDELKVFPVVDRLVEMAQDGTLTTSRGDAGEMLYNYWKSAPVRISEPERRKFVAQTIGVPGGDIRGPVNRECNDLWSRFVSSVSELVRQQSTDKLLRDTLPNGIRQQQVRKAARDIARNLSAHTYGMSLYLALELQEQINTIVKLLSDTEIRGVFGAKDMWQVIDHVATLELGGARDSSRYATLATCGAIITAWLADNVERYNGATSRPVIDLVEVLSTDPPTAGDQATVHPTDYDLVNACELWTIDMAFSEEKVEELSQPRESPASTSRPVPIPAIARELLDQSDLSSLGLGLGLARR